MKNDSEDLVESIIGPPPGSLSGSALASEISSRGPSGWVGTPIGLPYHIETTVLFEVIAPLLPVSFSDGLQTILWFSIVPLTPGAPPEGTSSVYLQSPGGSVKFIAPVGAILPVINRTFAGLSQDGKWLVFESAKHLLPADAARTKGRSVYAWHEDNLELVEVGSSGELLSTCGAKVSKFNGMSASGSRVFFSVPASCNGTEEVFLRDLDHGTTTDISESRCTRVDCNAPADVTFAGAAPSGDVAYLTTTQQLTNDDEDSGRDLYAYDVETGGLTLLSGGVATATGSVASANVAPSEIPGRIYFRASGELRPGESGSGEKLFVAEGGDFHLVAEGSIPVLEGEPQIQLTPDGRRALFVTPAQLLPGDTDGQADAYLYDAVEERLTLVSLGSSGGNAAYPVSITAPSPLNQHEFEAGDIRPYYALDASGEHIVFTTEESLVPEDTNAKPDVYEFWHGSVGLVSPGDEPYKSDLAGITRDGRSVIFATNADLIPSDQDANSRDLYVARFEGGFPEEAQVAGCNSSSCPLATQPRLIRQPPPSLARQAGKSAAKARLRLLRIAAGPRGGVIAASVSALSRGRLAGVLWVRRKHGKIVLARGAKRVRHPGKTRLALRLTRAGRHSGGGVRKAHLTIRQRSATISRVVKVKLR